MVIFHSYVSLPEGNRGSPSHNVFNAENRFNFLVGAFKHLDYFPFHIWDVILPIDELIFFKMVGIPPTRYHWHI